MNELPISIQRAVNRYKPIEVDGLTLAPVKVCNYTEFLLARSALEVMHQSLPVALMRVPLLSALYQMDYEAVLSEQTPSGLFSRALLALALSLRLGEGQELEGRMKAFQIIVDRKDPAKLQCLRFKGEGGEEREITPLQYAKLRPIIAAQNGVKLESDTANPDIVKAAKDRASVSDVQLDCNIEDWISAVSSVSGVAEEEIDEWPILKFQRRSDSFRRILDYIVCGIGECSGTTWKGGNPTPHPFFAKVANGNGILTALGGQADGTKPPPPQAATAIKELSKNL